MSLGKQPHGNTRVPTPRGGLESVGRSLFAAAGTDAALAMSQLS